MELPKLAQCGLVAQFRLVSYMQVEQSFLQDFQSHFHTINALCHLRTWGFIILLIGSGTKKAGLGRQSNQDYGQVQDSPLPLELQSYTFLTHVHMNISGQHTINFHNTPFTS